jgi:hypothetical protein
MRNLKIILLVMLGGMLAVRSGIFVVRMVREWNQPVSVWQPANENELMIWENYIYIDSGSSPE